MWGREGSIRMGLGGAVRPQRLPRGVPARAFASTSPGEGLSLCKKQLHVPDRRSTAGGQGCPPREQRGGSEGAHRPVPLALRHLAQGRGGRPRAQVARAACPSQPRLVLDKRSATPSAPAPGSPAVGWGTRGSSGHCFTVTQATGSHSGPGVAAVPNPGLEPQASGEGTCLPCSQTGFDPGGA